MNPSTARKLIYGFLTVNILIIVSWWLYISGLPATTTSDKLTALGRLTGLIAAFCALIELFFMSRLPIVERSFGLSKLVWLHRWNGYIMVYSLLAHLVLTTFGYQIDGRPGLIAQFLEFLFHFPDMFKALIGSVLILLAAGLSISIARKRVSYELWYLVHLTTYIAILLAFFHQLSTGGDLISYPIFRLYWVILIISAFTLIFIYRVFSPYLIWAATHSVVDRIVPETQGVYSLYIRGKNFNDLNIQAGQYFGFQFLGKNLWAQSHPFTLSRVPTANELRFTFKVYGSYTSYLSEIKPGTPVLLDGPRGNSTWERARKKKTLMIAGGIGITPMRALVESVPQNQNIVLIYACNSQYDAPLLNELMAISTKDKLTVIPIFSNIDGRITPEFIAQSVPDLINREVYLCGPDPMIDDLVEYLHSAGIDPIDIHTERFAY